MLLNVATLTEIINEWCCKLTCSMYAQCAAFMFEGVSKQCHLSSQVKLLQLTDNDGTFNRMLEVFVKNTIQAVTLTQNTGKYLDAKSNCLTL